MRDFDSYGSNLCDCSWQSDAIAKKLNYSSPKGDSRMPEESTQPKGENFREEDKGRCFTYFPLCHVWTKWGLAAAEMQPLVIYPVLSNQAGVGAELFQDNPRPLQEFSVQLG